MRRFPDLAIYTGTEVQIAAALDGGAAGTLCGLANVIPELLRLLSDGRTAADRQRYVPLVQAMDNVFARRPFIPALKAVIAHQTGEPAWRRVLPPLAEPLPADEQRLLAESRDVARSLPRAAPMPARPVLRAALLAER